MKWKSTALGEVMRHRKGSITIDDTTSYKLCRVQLHRRGVVLRQNLTGAAISTKKQQVCKAGDFLVAEMDAKVGGYGFVPAELDGAIVSSHYYLFEVDSEKLHPEYLEVVSQAEILQQQIVAKGSTNYSSIRPGSVLEWQIPLPEDLEVQKQIARNFRAVQSKLSVVCAEITHQQSLLAKLKQATLQEAIQGKLTADWRAAHPDAEPASQLLQCIQAEKARLIAAKKLRPEKPLPNISPDEIPFEIPNGWEWCRLGQIVILKSGNAYSFRETEDSDAVPYIKVGDMNIDGNREDATQSSTYFEYNKAMEGQFIPRKSIIFPKRGGAIATNKRCKVLSKSILVDSNTMAMCPSELLCFDFVFTWFSQIDLAKFGNSSVLPQVNNKDIMPLMIPLPPLAEQAAIVDQVERLMTTCRALEAEIENARTHAAHLLQAVLKEAFAPTAKVAA